MSNNEESKIDSRKLRIALEALKTCNQFHQKTGKNKIPLDEVADHIGLNKEEIQDAFDELVKTGEIGDDGDRDHMNYKDSGKLIDIIEKLLIAPEGEKEDKKNIEKELNFYT